MKDNDIVAYVANLARIELTPQESDVIGAQFSKILDYIDKLKEVDVNTVEPMRGLHTDHNVFRQDEVKVSPHRDAILNNAPATEDGSFKVPKVIE